MRDPGVRIPPTLHRCLRVGLALALCATLASPASAQVGEPMFGPGNPPSIGGSFGTGAGFGQPFAPPSQPGQGLRQSAPLAEVVTPAQRVFELNQRSVVNVNSVAAARVRDLGPIEQPRGVGSGFVLDTQGHIVTNNHVIEDADQISVTFPLPAPQGEITVPAELVGRDPINDLAVIKVDPNFRLGEGNLLGQFLDPVTLGNMEDIRIGQPAIAMGAPLGLTQSVTQGIVSAIRGPGDEAAAGLELVGGAIQTDAPINPGNSGGPLFNAQGEVIGVNTAILSLADLGGNIGIGFAIPVNVVKRVVPELIETGCFRHPLIGISALPLSQLGQEAKERLGLDPRQKGLLVQEASEGAAAAGIRAGDRVVTLGGERVRVGGDIVVGIEGRPVNTVGELRGFVENNLRPGDQVTLTILRNGQRQQVTVTLSERPNEVCPDRAGR